MNPELVVSTISAFLSTIGVLQTERAYRADKHSREYQGIVRTFRRQFRNERSILARDPQIQLEAASLVALLPSGTIEKFGDRIDGCIGAFDAAIDSSSPTVLGDAEKQLAECICTNLKTLKRTNGTIPPGKLRDFWKQYDCGPITW